MKGCSSIGKGSPPRYHDSSAWFIFQICAPSVPIVHSMSSTSTIHLSCVLIASVSDESLTGGSLFDIMIFVSSPVLTTSAAIHATCGGVFARAWVCVRVCVRAERTRAARQEGVAHPPLFLHPVQRVRRGVGATTPPPYFLLRATPLPRVVVTTVVVVARR